MSATFACDSLWSGKTQPESLNPVTKTWVICYYVKNILNIIPKFKFYDVFHDAMSKIDTSEGEDIFQKIMKSYVLIKRK